MESVSAGGAFELGGYVAPHVEALHFGGMGEWRLTGLGNRNFVFHKLMWWLQEVEWAGL